MLNIEITDREILTCTCAKHALRMTLDRGIKNMKAVAIDLCISEGLLSRALSTQYGDNLRHDLVVPFMASCGNAIYLRWLYLRAKELLPEMDKSSRPGDAEMIGAEIIELKELLRETIEEIKQSKAHEECRHCGSTAMFALSPGVGSLPKWLIAAALWIDFETGGVYE
jgi:hypothetical protein